MIRHIINVNIDTVQDCLQMGEFGRLTDYFIYLLDNAQHGSIIYLQRYPTNCQPLTYRVLQSWEDTVKWMEPFLKYF